MAQKGADQVTLVDLTDGYTVYLEKYAHIFDGNTSGALAGSTTCKVTAMVGPNVVPASVNLAAVTKPVGITVSKDTNSVTPTLTISADPEFQVPGFVTIPVVVDGGITIVQTMAVSFAKTGAGGTPGVSATLVGLKNEAQMIVTDSTGKTAGSTTVQVDFYGYVGSGRSTVTATVSSGLITGEISVGTNSAGDSGKDGVLTLVFAAGKTLGNADSGVVNVSLTCNGITRVQPFSWSKAKAGTNGSNGKDAITVEVTSSQGLVFKNTKVVTVLTATVYKGGVAQTAPQVATLGVLKWYKDGTYLSGKDGATLTVGAGDVTDRATYEVRLDG